MSQKLKTELLARELPFGSTNTGADWCVKALHPADPLTEVRGIPDHSAVPTLCMNYQSTFTLSIIPGQTTPWEFDMTLLPHPLYLAYWYSPKGTETISGRTVNGNMWNTQLVSSTVPTSVELNAAWLLLAQRWRLCYQSVTIYQDGPDLANQGTIVVSQSPLQAKKYSWSAADGTYGYAMTPLAWFDDIQQGPNFQRSQALPNAMMGRSRDGAYVPLKLTETSQDWQSASDLITPYQPSALGPAGTTTWTRLPTVPLTTYPFPVVIGAYEPNPGNIHGDVVPNLLNGSVAHISARNLSDQTSFTFHFRLGLEVQLAPSSTLTPQLKLSPPYDRQALDTYFQIARELKDGYPADYNDLGRIWDVISGAAKRILPIAQLVPGLAAPASLARDVVSAGDTVRRFRQNGRKPQGAQVQRPPPQRRIPIRAEPRVALRDKPSQATVERAQTQRIKTAN